MEVDEKEGFHEHGDEPGARRQRLNNDELAIKRATELPNPTKYSATNQRALDKFIREVETHFRAKPSIYGTEQKRCTFAGVYLDGTPSAD